MSQLYICPNWKECKEDCVKSVVGRNHYHNKPHDEIFEDRSTCKAGFASGPCPPCIPVYEVKTWTYCLTYPNNKCRGIIRVGGSYCKETCGYFIKTMDDDTILCSCTENKPAEEKMLAENLFICDHAKECDYKSCIGAKAFRQSDVDGWTYFRYDKAFNCGFINKSVKRIPYKEEKPMPEYKKLKPCTMLIMEKDFVHCFDFRNACKDWIDRNYGFNQEIAYNDLISVATKHNGITHLINKGYIEKVEPEVFYKVGDEFIHNDGNQYKLSYLKSSKMAALVSKCGYFYGPLVPAKNPEKITKNEFNAICHDFIENFTKIEDNK